MRLFYGSRSCLNFYQYVSKAAQTAAKKAAVFQAGYTGELERTQSHIASLQQQLNLDRTETLTAAKIKAEQKYQDAISKTNEAISKQLAQGSISPANAEVLKKQKELEASLQKQLDIKQAEEKQTHKNVQAAQGQLKFYKELAKLSGSYSNDLELQKVLIADQAKKYRDVYGIAGELVAEWERLTLLQESNDPFDGAYRGILKFQAEMADTGSQWESLSYDLAKNFTSATRNCFDEFIDTGKASLDSFKNLFKTFLKDLIWQAAAQPIMLSIVGGVGGMLGASSAYGATGSIGGIGTVGAGSGSASLLETGMQIGQQATMKSVFSGSGGLFGGITDTINNTMASWFPSTFANSAVANGTFVGPLPAGASTTSFTSALGTAGIGYHPS